MLDPNKGRRFAKNNRINDIDHKLKLLEIVFLQ